MLWMFLVLPVIPPSLCLLGMIQYELLKIFCHHRHAHLKEI